MTNDDVILKKTEVSEQCFCQKKTDQVLLTKTILMIKYFLCKNKKKVEIMAYRMMYSKSKKTYVYRRNILHAEMSE